MLPAEITGAELDRHVRGQLSTLSDENALTVAKHLVAAGAFLDDDPELAYAHATAAVGRAGRIAVVREAAGFAAYRTGRHEEALREFRTVRRLTGSHELLPLIADCERGRGRPQRAVELLDAPEVASLDRATQLELLIVGSGARRDLGQTGAAVVLLQVPELTGAVKPSLVDARARLLMAYSEALADDGRAAEAARYQRLALANDPHGVLAEPQDDSGDVFTDLEEAADE